MTPLGIVHPIKTRCFFRVHGCEGMVRGQKIIIERSSVIRRLRAMLLFAFAFLGFRACVDGGRGVIHFFL
jgi:hypothetical protein